MSLKTRITFWSGFIFLLFFGIFVFIQGMPDTVMADPATLPPTIDKHLSNINSNMQFIKIMGGALSGMIALVGALIVYIFKSTVANIKGSIHHVERNFNKNLEDHKDDIRAHEEEIGKIKEKFLSIETHRIICPHSWGGERDNGAY